MKKRVLELVTEYRRTEHRISQLKNGLKDNDFFINSFRDEDISLEEEWTTKDQVKRLKVFLKQELEIEVARLKEIEKKLLIISGGRQWMLGREK